ncbi:hypothetical protein ACFLVB_05430 [Chloroflexota bacterium]
MPGKAYNPKGFEPDAHQRFNGVPEKAIDAYRGGARRRQEEVRLTGEAKL